MSDNCIKGYELYVVFSIILKSKFAQYILLSYSRSTSNQGCHMLILDLGLFKDSRHCPIRLDGHL